MDVVKGVAFMAVKPYCTNNGSLSNKECMELRSYQDGGRTPFRGPAQLPIAFSYCKQRKAGQSLRTRLPLDMSDALIIYLELVNRDVIAGEQNIPDHCSSNALQKLLS